MAQFNPHQYPNVKPQQNAFEFDRLAINRFLAHCTHRKLEAKCNVFVPGDRANLLYYVVSGSLMVVSSDDEHLHDKHTIISEKKKSFRYDPEESDSLTVDSFSDTEQSDAEQREREIGTGFDTAEYDETDEAFGTSFLSSPLMSPNFRMNSADVLNDEICSHAATYRKMGVKDEGKEKELVVSYIGAGDFIGELGLFYPSYKRNVTLKTRTAVEIAEIPYEKMLHLLATDLAADSAKILFEIGSQISKRLLNVTRKASGLAFVDVRERVMRAAIELTYNAEALTHPKGMQIKASRQELAKMSACSREMAGRALKELEEEGRLTAHGKTIVVFGTR